MPLHFSSAFGFRLRADDLPLSFRVDFDFCIRAECFQFCFGNESWICLRSDGFSFCLRVVFVFSTLDGGFPMSFGLAVVFAFALMVCRRVSVLPLNFSFVLPVFHFAWFVLLSSTPC